MADRLPNHRPARHHLPRPNRAPETRPSAALRGYDRTWARWRLMVLREEPMCRSCGGAASQVDHITPLSRGGTNDRENLQPLCHSCHSRKTALEQLRTR
jgi:5-methylcytosine-specific restriction protein A